METLTKRYIEIDLKQANMLPTPQFIQQDSNILEFIVKENGVDADLSNIGKIIVNYKRPDNKVISRLINAEGNKVIYEIGQEEMKVHGEGLIEIQFYSLDVLQRISTRVFKINLSQSIGTTGINEDDKNLTILQQLMIEVTELNTQITSLETARESAEAIRQSQELVRESNENGRELAESERAIAENERQENVATALTNIESATLSANTASTNAENQANYAKTQGDYAREKGDIALTNATEAFLATDEAKKATEQAQNLVDTSKHLREYNPTANYVVNNEVRYNGSTWRCMKNNKGIYPSESEYWTLVAQRGVDGTGSVSTVNGKLPDENGNVQITASELGSISYIEAQDLANQAETNAKNASVSKTELGVAGGAAMLNAEGNVIDADGNEVKGAVKSVNGQTGDVTIPVFSGNYDDLNNKPTIPSKTSELLNDSDFETIKGSQEKISAHALQTDVHGLKGKTIALGEKSDASGWNALAIGTQAVSSGDSSLAIGVYAKAKMEWCTALGINAIANGNYSIAIGTEATTNSTNGLAIGYQSTTSGYEAISIGYNAKSLNNFEGTLGNNKNNWIVPGSFSVTGTKNFEIPHPHPDKSHTHVIRHGAVESPTAGDTLYRYQVEATLDGETVEVQLPDYFQYLNKNVDVHVSPHMHFGRAFGYIEGDILKVSCEKVGIYKTLVIGTRNDDHHTVQNWDIKGVEREIGESWMGETQTFEVSEISEVEEIKEVLS